MKPYYEEVLASDLKIGDEVKIGFRPAVKWSQQNADDIRYLRYEDGVAPRKLPPERNPDVLMRAIEFLHDEIVGINSSKYFPRDTQTVDEYIQQAIRELEREAKR